MKSKSDDFNVFKNKLKRINKVNNKIFLKYKIKQAKDIIKLASKVFDNIIVAFSGGKDSLVALHLSLEIIPDVPVLFNYTTVEFPETVKYVKKLQKMWGFKLYIAKPKTGFFKAVKERGWASHENRWCCKMFKDDPAYDFLIKHDFDAEITGTIRTESIYRRWIKPITIPKKNPPIIRIHPIYDWNPKEVWEYIKLHELPYNPLYDLGYRRIGCWACPLNGPSHYRRLEKTHPHLYRYIENYLPRHPFFNGKTALTKE